MDGIQGYAAGEYHNPDLKELAKALKSGNPDAIRRAAVLMAGWIGQDTVLVPIPSHTGRAGYTLQLAIELSRLTDAPVADILMSRSRQSSYELKKQGVVLEAEDMGFRLAAEPPAGKRIFLVDNVVASGNTAKAALKLLPDAVVLALADDSRAIGRLPGITVHLRSTDKVNHSNMKTEKKQGVILVKADGMTMAADLYRNPSQRERIWKDWVDVAMNKGLYKHVDFSVSDYPSALSPFRGLTDKQIGFLLDSEKPERTVTAMQAVFAKRNKADYYDADAVRSCVNVNEQAYQHFMAQLDPIAQRLNTLRLAETMAVENVPRVQRIYRLKDRFAFDGGERIAGLDDVAWLFRHLQDRSVENTYAVMTKGDESIVLQLAVGNINSALVETHVVAETARRMEADKVWFVHNHPSGDIMASREDVNIHKLLKEQLGNILQPSVIINTDTGKYGVFTEKCCGTHYWDWYTSENRGKKYVEIPVYAFDKRLFHGKGAERYKLDDANEIAKFLSTQRLGERDKYSLLAMNRKMHLNGYYHLPYSDLKQVSEKELAGHMASLAIHSQAQAVILVGKDDGQLIQKADSINDALEHLVGGSVKLMDVVQVNRNDILSRSWYNEKMEAEELMKKKNPHMRLVAARESDGKEQWKDNPVVDNVQITMHGQEPFVNARIRCRIDGEQQMFRDMHPADFQKWKNSTGDDKVRLEHTLSLKYFQDSLDEKMNIQSGVKR